MISKPCSQSTATTNFGRTPCSHLFEDARHCGSPALRGEHFCYFHHSDRKPVKDPYIRRARRGFDLPIPTDKQSLNRVLGEIIQRLASNRIDTKRASLLLYSLQIAANTLPYAAPPAVIRVSPSPAKT